jgi:hypothetical protein
MTLVAVLLPRDPHGPSRRPGGFRRELPVLPGVQETGMMDIFRSGAERKGEKRPMSLRNGLQDDAQHTRDGNALRSAFSEIHIWRDYALGGCSFGAVKTTSENMGWNGSEVVMDR